MRNRKEYYEYPSRTCYWLNHCAVCEQDIVAGQKYYDGGYFFDKQNLHTRGGVR